MAVALGGNDAATPCDTSVGARVISVRKSLILFAAFTSLGALTQGYMVMKTIGRGIVPAVDLLGVLVTISVAFAWIMFCNYYGLEISVTHSITGAVIGYGLAAYGLGQVNLNLLYKIIISWVTSPLFALLMAYTVYKLIVHMVRENNSLAARIMPALLIAALCYSAYAFGTNDIANATGVYVTVSQIVFGGIPEQNVMFILAALGSVGVAAGGFLLGSRVIGTVAFKITRLDPISGFAAELSNAFVVHMFTTIPYLIFGYGIPISTSIAGVGAVIGVGLAMYRSAGVNKSTVLKLFMAWIGTVTVTAVASYILYTLIAPITGPILKPKA
ncbi:inorganic phosphate transporter [Candidatus Bathyarchaeota archaeon]|nr:inorganic phosphate transporter [Candidatus Bathyarchaeota archaeon]